MSSKTGPDGPTLERAFKARIVNCALGDLLEVDPFSLAYLARHGLVEITGGGEYPSHVVDILLDPNHSRRTGDVPGPFIFFRGDNDEPGVLWAAEMLSMDSLELRAAAVRHLQDLGRCLRSAVVETAAQEAEMALRGGNEDDWISHGERLFRLTDADYQINLAGFRQCYAEGFVDGLERCLQVVLRPSAPALRNLEADIGLLSQAPEDISRQFDVIVGRSASLSEALDEWYRTLGHAPVTGARAISALLDVWSKSRDAPDLWSVLWEWADRRQSPVARYHLCVFFLSRPEYVPRVVSDTLWSEVAEVIRVQTTAEKPSRWGEAWRLRERLALHYSCYLECVFPGGSGEPLMSAALWLTERLAESIPTLSAGRVRTFRESAVEQQAEHSALEHQLCCPPVRPSPLRYLLRRSCSTWPTSLVSEFVRASSSSLPAPSEDHRRIIDEGLVHVLVRSCPTADRAPHEAIFGFELPLSAGADSWLKLTVARDAQSQELIAGLSSAYTPFLASEGLAQIADALVGTEDTFRRIASRSLYLRAYGCDAPGAAGELFWKLMKDDARWIRFLDTADEQAVMEVSEAVMQMAMHSHGDWTIEVPHSFAGLCERIADDDERRATFFELTVLASLQGNTGSAIARVLSNAGDGVLSSLAMLWHSHLSVMAKNCGPWARGRISGMLPHFHLE